MSKHSDGYDHQIEIHLAHAAPEAAEPAAAPRRVVGPERTSGGGGERRRVRRLVGCADGPTGKDAGERGGMGSANCVRLSRWRSARTTNANDLH